MSFVSTPITCVTNMQYT